MTQKNITLSTLEMIFKSLNAICAAFFCNNKDEAINLLDDKKYADFFEKHYFLGAFVSASAYNKWLVLFLLFVFIFAMCFFIWTITYAWQTFWFLANEISEVI